MSLYAGVATVLGFAAAGAYGQNESGSRIVVATLPAEGALGTFHLYGQTRAGRPFRVSEGTRIEDGWDLVLFRFNLPRDEIGLLVVCNERWVAETEAAAREPRTLERFCSPVWNELPEPSGFAAGIAAIALLCRLQRRRRRDG